MSEITNGVVEMKSKYLLTKRARELVVSYQVKNADYEKDLLEEQQINPSMPLSTNLVRNNETQVIAFNKN